MRGLNIFLSAGEPSGDLHGSNFLKTLHQLTPDCQVHGFGGPLMEKAGQKQLFPLADFAVMGVLPVLKSLGTFTDLYKQADRWLSVNKPDAVVLIDYPGFHWWIAKSAHRHRIPVFYFVPPQIWAWATYRVSRMRRWVSHVFCNLPFEEEWYQSRGVKASFVGHPYFDALATQQLKPGFIQEQMNLPGRVIALLPGSRTHEVTDNITTMMNTARIVHQKHPETRFLVAAYKEKQASLVRGVMKQYPDLPVQVHTGKTPEIIHLCEMCLSVSGSVSLELLHAARPVVTLYQITPMLQFMVRRLKKAKYISLINLLAERELSPEFLVSYDASREMAEVFDHWLTDRRSYLQTQEAMRELRDEVAIPGACERAVAKMLELLGNRLNRMAA